jgi:hypothetical protein
MVYGESSMCGYTLVQAVSWIGEQVCYETVVIVVVVVVVIIILKWTYDNIPERKFPFDKLYTTDTSMQLSLYSAAVYLQHLQHTTKSCPT